MKVIQINYLPHNNQRFNYSKWCLKELTKIKSENKEKIYLKIYSSYNDSWENVIDDLKANGINCEFVFLEGYMPKIFNAIESEFQYSCKWDEDVFLNYNSWDYILENLQFLDENDDILFLSPIITNGIPSVDLFVSEQFNTEYKEKYFSLIKDTDMIGNPLANSWGVDYSFLNSETIEKDKFDSEKYYKKVSELNHYYKGIHPARISMHIHNLLYEFIADNKNVILNSDGHFIFKVNRPYFCNSFFFIKTNNWKESQNDSSLFRDGFDEVPLNLYREIKKIPNMAFVSQAYAMHMAYNTIGAENQNIIETRYCEAFKQEIELSTT